MTADIKYLCRFQPNTSLTPPAPSPDPHRRSRHCRRRRNTGNSCQPQTEMMVILTRCLLHSSSRCRSVVRMSFNCDCCARPKSMESREKTNVWRRPALRAWNGLRMWKMDGQQVSASGIQAWTAVSTVLQYSLNGHPVEWFRLARGFVCGRLQLCTTT